MNDLAAGAIIGGMVAFVLTTAAIAYILIIISWWKIFTKAGIEGWKSIIPIYNIYIFCKIIGMSFWIFYLGIPLAIGVITAIIGNESVSNLISRCYALFVDIYTAILLGKVFNKGTGFKVGLALLPNIFLLILAFGSSKYVGISTKESA